MPICCRMWTMGARPWKLPSSVRGWRRERPGHSNRAEIATQAEDLIRKWGIARGGFILGDYGDANAIGVDPSLKAFMRQTFQQLDP